MTRRAHKSDPLQEDLPLFASIAAHSVFPGRNTLHCKEVAKVIGCTPRQIADLCAEGVIKGAVNIAGVTNNRSINFWRIPVSAYDAWIRTRSNLESAENAHLA